MTYLDYCFTANKMSTTSNGDATARTINDLLAALNQLLDVTEPRRAVRIGKERILPAHMAQAVRHAAALAAVPLQAHDAQHIVQFLLVRELEHHVNRLVPAAVVDDDDFVARRHFWLRCHAVVVALLAATCRRRVGGCFSAGGAGDAAKVFVEILDGFFECGQDAVLFIVRRQNYAQTQLRRFNGSRIRYRMVAAAAVLLLLLGQSSLREPAIVPARESSGRRGRAIRAARNVRLLRGECGARFGSDEVEQAEKLFQSQRNQKQGSQLVVSGQGQEGGAN